MVVIPETPEVEVEETEGNVTTETLPEEIVGPDVIVNDPTAVLPVDFMANEFCKDFNTMSITDFNTCVNYVALETDIGFYSLFLGLLCGFILAKSVSDGWG